MSVETVSYETLAAEYAERGAAVLDRLRPGWHNRIDVDKIDMNNGYAANGERRCILCQLSEVGQFLSDDMDDVWEATQQCADIYGFMPLYGDGIEFLNEAWRDEILKRRGTCSPTQA